MYSTNAIVFQQKCLYYNFSELKKKKNTLVFVNKCSKKNLKKKKRQKYCNAKKSYFFYNILQY